MKNIRLVLVSLMVLASSVFAIGNQPFVANISSGSPDKVMMATMMTSKFQKAGHPTTVFLNCQAVKAASKSHKEYEEAQKNLKKIIKNGGAVLVCPMCIERNNIDPNNLLDGATVTNHQMVEKAVFAPDARVLSW
jgi:intracellular sulfur oxidation DsrE/DsrF family protein